MTTTNRWTSGLYRALVLLGYAPGILEIRELWKGWIFKKTLPAHIPTERLESIGWAGCPAEEIPEIAVDEVPETIVEEVPEVIEQLPDEPLMCEAIKGTLHEPEHLPWDMVPRRIVPIGNEAIEVPEAIPVVLH